jgi:hypothetical protein
MKNGTVFSKIFPWVWDHFTQNSKVVLLATFVGKNRYNHKNVKVLPLNVANLAKKVVGFTTISG